MRFAIIDTKPDPAAPPDILLVFDSFEVARGIISAQVARELAPRRGFLRRRKPDVEAITAAVDRALETILQALGRM